MACQSLFHARPTYVLPKLGSFVDSGHIARVEKVWPQPMTARRDSGETDGLMICWPKMCPPGIRRRSSADFSGFRAWLGMVNEMAMDQYLYIPFLMGWTSIYQLFWCSPGVPRFWHTARLVSLSCLSMWMYTWDLWRSGASFFDRETVVG